MHLFWHFFDFQLLINRNLRQQLNTKLNSIKNKKNLILPVHGAPPCVNKNTVQSPEVYQLAKPHTG